MGNLMIDGLMQVIVVDQIDFGLYVQWGDVFYENCGYDEVICDYIKAIQLDIMQFVYYYKLVDVYLDYFKLCQVVEIFKCVVECFLEDIFILLKLSEYYFIFIQYEEFMKAIDCVFKIDLQNVEVYFMFGMNFEEWQDMVCVINSY